MADEKKDEFDIIKSLDEITRILKVAVTLNIEVYCELTDLVSPTVVELDIRGVSGTQVVFGVKRESGAPGQLLDAVFPKGLKAGTPIEVIFGLVDGQYAIRDVVQDVSMTTFTIDASRNLLRLQRRKDFRVAVKNEGLKFVAIPPSKDEIAKEFRLLDLSAGGLRMLWPTKSHGPVPALGTVIPGTVHLSPKGPDAGKQAEVELALVKNHGVDVPSQTDPEYSLSFQFKNLSQENARAILFVCLFIHRANYGTR